MTSDPVCPWCYIGYRRLTRAIRLYQNTYPGGSQDAIRITWKPYIMDANALMESIPYMEPMSRKLGPEKVPHAQAHLQRLGCADGIHFHFSGRIGGTLPAHQALMLSQLQEKLAPLRERIGWIGFQYWYGGARGGDPRGASRAGEGYHGC